VCDRILYCILMYSAILFRALVRSLLVKQAGRIALAALTWPVGEQCSIRHWLSELRRTVGLDKSRSECDLVQSAPLFIAR
jgi:hypothetical protein